MSCLYVADLSNFFIFFVGGFTFSSTFEAQIIPT